MKRRVVGIRETGTTFTTGVVFSPSWDDLHAVVAKLHKLGLMKDLVPEVRVDVILAHRGAMLRTVPLILERADIRRYREVAPDEILALLWVVACFNYRYCHGPYPGTIKRKRYPRRKPVLEFRCPFCGRDVYEPNPRYKSRRVIIEQYANALHRHAKDCEELLHLDRRVK